MNEQIKQEGKDIAAVMSSKAILCSVSIHRLGIRRDVKSTSVAESTGADAEMVRVSKKLIDSTEYDAIVKQDGEFYRRLMSRALPSRLRRGTYLLPIGLIGWAEDEIKTYRDCRAALIEDFLRVYQTRCEEARDKLGELYDERQYPSLSQVQAAFNVKVAYEAYSAPALLEQIDASLYRREQQRIREATEAAALEARQALRVGMLEVVGKLQEELQPKPDGTPRKLYDSVIANLLEFLDLLQARNITNDAELQRIGDELREVVKGVDRKILKSNQGIREGVASALAETSKSLGAMVQDAPRRKFSFDNS